MTKTVPEKEFEQHVLALLTDVAEHGDEVVVTKDGKPVAKLVAMTDRLKGPMDGTIEVVGDVVAPLDEEWNAAKS